MSVRAAARRTAEGRAAVLLGDAVAPVPGGRGAAPGARDATGSEPGASPAQPVHLFMLDRATLVSTTDAGRRRLHHFEADTDVRLEPEERPLADLLLRLGSACRALPAPGKRHSLVRLDRPSDIAGLRLGVGAVAAIDFDPLSVLPELRGLGLYPWHVLPIEQLGEDGCQGPALEHIRLVVRLDQPWQPLRSAGFLAGVYVDTTYRDYRRQPPTGEVLRAYFVHGDRRPPRAVFGRPEADPKR